MDNKLKALILKSFFISILLCISYGGTKSSGYEISPKTIIEFIPHRIDGMENTRGLGGYNTRFNKTTKFKAFLRSDSIHFVTDEEINILKQYGIRTVIDLRSKKEKLKNPDIISLDSDISYYNIDINIENENMKRYINGNCCSLNDCIGLLGGREKTKEVFEIISNAPEGGILFHCKYGKDRTGILSMLLLGLAGASREDIINDYCITYDCIRENQIVERGIKKYGDLWYLSSPSYITPILEFIDSNYNSFDELLFSCGISKDTIEKVKSRII